MKPKKNLKISDLVDDPPETKPQNEHTCKSCGRHMHLINACGAVKTYECNVCDKIYSYRG
jgi:hypothetical protein